MDSTYAIGVVCVVAVCTMLTRTIPFILFGKNTEPAPIIKYLGKMLPPAVMAILVVYCLKGVNFTSGASFLPELISVATVSLLQLWKRNTLLSIGAGTACYMFMVQSVFA